MTNLTMRTTMVAPRAQGRGEWDSATMQSPRAPRGREWDGTTMESPRAQRAAERSEPGSGPPVGLRPPGRGDGVPS